MDCWSHLMPVLYRKELKILQPNCTSVNTQPSERQRRQKSGDIEYDRSGVRKSHSKAAFALSRSRHLHSTYINA